MKYKKLTALFLAACMLFSAMGTVNATEGENTATDPPSAVEDTQPTETTPPSDGAEESGSDEYLPESMYTTGNAITVFAHDSGEVISGEGNTDTNVEVQEKTQDEFIQDRIDEMASHFGEDYSDMYNNFPDESNAETADEYLQNIQTTPNVNQDLTDYYNSQEVDKNVYTMETDGIFVQAEDFVIPDYQLISFADLYGKLQEQRYQFNLENVDTKLFMGVDGKIYDTESGSLESSGYMEEYIREMLNWLNGGNGDQHSAMTEYWENQSLQSLIDYTNGGVQTQQVGNSEMYFGVAINNSVLHDSLYNYISALHNIGVNNIKVTKYTVYTAESFAVRTVRVSTPTYPLQYHWTVSTMSGNDQVDQWTETQPYIRILFESAGDYYVKVAQNKNVIRNNKVSGYKTEIWTLNNGDIFDGLVFYNHTTTFEAFLAEDIGPTVEELQLTKDSFIANVSEQMAGKTQMLDENGYLHQAADGFSTERN